MASNTPNLNLLKKDPVTDGNDTFNIQTMLNDNWDKIDEAIGDVREELQDINIPPASLTEAGIVRLSNSTSGTREDVAATELAVKTTYDAAAAAQTTANAANLAAAAAQTKADQAFQLGNERKSEVVAALVAKGISASTSESWDSLLSKLTSLIKATGNATAADVLAGKTFSNASGNDLTGSMPNRGAVANTITTQNGQYTIPAGYHNGSGKVTASLPNLTSDNVKKGVNIGGIIGELEPSISGKIDLNISSTSFNLSRGQSKEVILATIPAGAKRICLLSDWRSTDATYYRYANASSSDYLTGNDFRLKDSAGNYVPIQSFSPRGILHSFMYDFDLAWYTRTSGYAASTITTNYGSLSTVLDTSGTMYLLLYAFYASNAPSSSVTITYSFDGSIYYF